MLYAEIIGLVQLWPYLALAWPWVELTGLGLGLGLGACGLVNIPGCNTA